jgi:hypothetical protein
MPRELLEEQREVGIADGLCGLDPLYLAVEGGPAHALGLVDGVSNAAIRSEALAGTSQEALSEPILRSSG